MSELLNPLLSSEANGESAPASNRETQDSRANVLYRLLLIPLMTMCYYQIEHDWTASTRAEEVTGIRYDGTENRTADRSEQVNAGSSSSRIMLACFALLGLGIPCASRFKPNVLVFWCLLLHIGWMLTTYLWAKDPGHTGFKLVVLCVFTFTAFGLSRQMTFDQIGRVFALVCVGFLLYGWYAELRLGTFHLSGDYRYCGTVHPNTMAVYSSIACIAAVLFYRPEHPRSFFTALFVFGIGFLFLFLTKSRTSLAAMLMGVTAFYAIRFRGMKRLILIAGATCTLAMGTLMMTVVSAQMKGALGNAAAMGRDDDVTSLTGRLPLWEELLEWVAKSPLIGHGYMGMWTAERVEYLGDLFKWEIPHAHNMYIDVLLDGGIIGLSFFLLYLLVGIFSSASRFLRTDNQGAAFCFALIFFALVHGSAESFFKQAGFVNLCLYTLLFRLAWTGPDDVDIVEESRSIETENEAQRETPSPLPVV